MKKPGNTHTANPTAVITVLTLTAVPCRSVAMLCQHCLSDLISVLITDIAKKKEHECPLLHMPQTWTAGRVKMLPLLVMDFQAKFICCTGSGSVLSLLDMGLSSEQVPSMFYIITRGREKTWMLMIFPRWRRKAEQQSSSTQQCQQHCNPLGTRVLFLTAVPPSAQKTHVQTTLNTDGTKLGDLYQRWALPEKEDHESRTLRCINIDLYTMRNFIWKNLLLPGKKEILEIMAA